MTAQPGQFIDAPLSAGFDDLTLLGFVPGVDSPHVLGFVDPIENPAQRNEHESPRGVEVRRHPWAMLRDDPELWDIVDRFRCGVQKDLTHAEYDTLSAWQVEAWLIMRAAQNREELRQIKDRGPSHGD